MVRQERAEQTREALLGAAAAEFDRNGYHGTSLSRVCKSAGVTMGALTFHFPAKADLADAVQASGCRATGGVLRGYRQAAPGLRTAAGLTDALVGLLEREPVVRAAARLSRERPDTGADWYAAWLPVLEHCLPHTDLGIDPVIGPVPVLQLAHAPLAHGSAGTRTPVRAPRGGGARAAGGQAGALASLVRYLVVGAESALREEADRPGPHEAHTPGVQGAPRAGAARHHLAWFWTAVAAGADATAVE
ncbi:helix-turn-helix domain-containing protein [Streptacidiphilus sp. PB12-B1b]|uniref:helix-turn-helix domain-containing protein n=1 Tax=Streptacidiphilus sp. PB12-B1b TaxID=2705012 RepID=UPI00272D0A9F|nr:helix-turn-helix domain-containing protein [Streptacidiphilus sp. PB12-B1b]